MPSTQVRVSGGIIMSAIYERAFRWV